MKGTGGRIKSDLQKGGVLEGRERGAAVRGTAPKWRLG